jgi:hypothetical protein
MRTLTDFWFPEVQTVLRSWNIHKCVHNGTVAALTKLIDTQQYWYVYVAASVDEVGWDSLGYLLYGRLAAHGPRLVQDIFCQEFEEILWKDIMFAR